MYMVSIQVVKVYLLPVNGIDRKVKNYIIDFWIDLVDQVEDPS